MKLATKLATIQLPTHQVHDDRSRGAWLPTRAGPLGRAALAIVAVVLLACLAGCGNAGTTSGSGAPGTGGTSAGQASQITVSGAVNGTISSSGTCSTDSSGQYKAVWTATLNNSLYLFQIDVLHSTGAGTYQTAQTEGSPSVDLTDESGASQDWHSQYSARAGNIVLNANLTSGTVDATLFQNVGASGSSVHATGNWTCSA